MTETRNTRHELDRRGRRARGRAWLSVALKVVSDLPRSRTRRMSAVRRAGPGREPTKKRKNRRTVRRSLRADPRARDRGTVDGLRRTSGPVDRYSRWPSRAAEVILGITMSRSQQFGPVLRCSDSAASSSRMLKDVACILRAVEPPNPAGDAHDRCLPPRAPRTAPSPRSTPSSCSLRPASEMIREIQGFPAVDEEELRFRASTSPPQWTILSKPMAEPGAEVILGITQDQQFGPVADVRTPAYSSRCSRTSIPVLCRLEPRDASEMIARSRASRCSGLPRSAANLEAIRCCCSSEFAEANPEIAEGPQSGLCASRRCDLPWMRGFCSLLLGQSKR